ncbi:MAG: hypothetical protein M3083_04245 [Actinomycetota bacterium]|nr:hypothetical protein [Actinomycetota bacterium]
MDEEIAEWTREEMGLGDDATVAVREKPGNDPRCSPVVTELTIESPGESAFVFHVERPLAEVTRMDIVASIAFGGH